ncbi:MAG: methenyltetrahydrofolate cyclohydrolase [Alkaliphilus sp.]|nr:cyclodeaminase/cyclohydrolase family protein [Alkaliphilus sp. AH-315-G20]PHS31341.1 MAG: methenyltetrahydrofolate cyclohydrolase [Alkaliphilus sp.]
MLAEMKLSEFLEKTASNKPVPGGGSVAAMSAATAAALTEMVANLTIGKKKYIEVEEEMKSIAQTVKELRKKLVEAIDRDAEAFNGVMSAFKMPKNTEEQVDLRKIQIQNNMKKAALVPLEVAKDAFSMMGMISSITEKGNKNAVTDAAVAAMMARTAVLSALYNVRINLASIKDQEFVEKISLKASELETKIVEEEKKILSKVEL